jgi:hypothetical protein
MRHVRQFHVVNVIALAGQEPLILDATHRLSDSELADHFRPLALLVEADDSVDRAWRAIPPSAFSRRSLSACCPPLGRHLGAATR